MITLFIIVILNKNYKLMLAEVYFDIFFIKTMMHVFNLYKENAKYPLSPLKNYLKKALLNKSYLIDI